MLVGVPSWSVLCLCCGMCDAVGQRGIHSSGKGCDFQGETNVILKGNFEPRAAWEPLRLLCGDQTLFGAASTCILPTYHHHYHHHHHYSTLTMLLMVCLITIHTFRLYGT